MDYAEKMQRCHEYVEALEEERRKIQVFQRELPLCLDLVTQAIEACRKELSGTTAEYLQGGQSDCSEQTSSDGPVLEEFIPIKRNDNGNGNSDQDADDPKDVEEEDRSSHKTISKNKSDVGGNNKDKDKDHKRKSDWLRSVQLWNQSPDPLPPSNKEEVPRKAVATEVKRNGTGGAFQPFQREKSAVGGRSGNGNNSNGNGDVQAVSNKAVPSSSVVVPASAASSSVETVGSGGGTSRKEDKESAQRKQRRCWSPELHRRFLQALQQLGGSHVATPKQIRELMKVDGLTNDEVKSHLQKYRLHTRRPSPTIHNNNPQTPQFVVVGGIWVPPPEYAAVSATTASGEATTIATANGIFAPVATTPAPPPTTAAAASVAQKPDHQRQDLQVSEGRGSHSEGGHACCNSPATSSSTHTTTTSPVY